MSAIEVIGLDHIVLRVKDLNLSMNWYKRILGCTEERSVPDFGLYQLRLGTALIDLVPVNGKLGKSGGGAPGKYKRNMDHFAVQLIEFDEAKIHAQLRRYGVDPSSIERRYGSLGHGPSMYVYDPDGNTIELKGPPDKDQKENIQSAIYKSSVQARAATEFAKKTILTSARRRKNTVKGGVK